MSSFMPSNYNLQNAMLFAFTLKYYLMSSFVAGSLRWLYLEGSSHWIFLNFIIINFKIDDFNLQD